MEKNMVTSKLKKSEIKPANLASTLDELFGGSRTEFTLKSGTVVTFKPAKLRQLGAITTFLQVILERVPADKLTALLQSIANEQQKAIDAGKSHNDLQMEAVSMVTKAMGHNSLILGVLSHTIDLLPALIGSFTTLSDDEVEEIDLDDMVVVIMGILAVNYSFFTHSLPPIVQSALRGWQAKKNQSETNLGALSANVARIVEKKK